MVKNDQTDIIDALKNKDLPYVWERVKFIGVQDVPNISERMIIFFKAASVFDPTKNNNFILFYKNYLKHLAFDQNSTYNVTRNREIISQLKRQLVSPEEIDKNLLLYELQHWSN